MNEFVTPVGRIVSGHPMIMRQNKDDKGIPKVQADGATPSKSSFVALAIPKGPEQHWNQTEWGQKIWSEIMTSWPNGEYQMPTFSFKVEDGDSQVPNKKMKKNCDREGYPGHWIIKASTSIPYGSYHVGKYLPTDVIKVENEIKTGDYGRLNIMVKGNSSTQTPGIYINPNLFELSRAGVQIIAEGGADAASAFGGVAPVIPQGAQIDTAVAAQVIAAPVAAHVIAAPVAAQVVTPAADFVNGPPPVAQTPPPVAAPAPAPVPVQVKYMGPDGKPYTMAQLVAGGWTEAQVLALPQG